MDIEGEGEPDTSIAASAQLARQKETAESFKEQANSQFASGHYRDARDLYTKAIVILLSESESASNPPALLDKEYSTLLATLYSNLAATHLMLKEYSLAECHSSKAVTIDPTYVKAYIRHAKALTEMGSFDVAISSLKRGAEVVNDSRALEKELTKITRIRQSMMQGLSLLEANEFASAKATFGRLLKETEAPNVLLGAARSDLGLGLTDSTLRLTMQVLKKHPQNSEGYCTRGLCYIQMTEFDSGLKLLKEAMRMDPDSSRISALRKEALRLKSLVGQLKEASFRRSFDEVVEKCTHAIQTSLLLPPKSPLFGWLCTERATANLRLKAYPEVLKDCALVLYHSDDNINAWLIRFSALHDLERHEEVLAEVEQLMQKWGANEGRIRRAYEKADFEVRKKKRPDFYKLLNVSSIASEREIKKAYRQRALDLHPDRFAGRDDCTEQLRKQAEQEFQVLGQGLEILTDDFTRKLYDEGFDLEAIHQRVEASQRAAHGGRGHHHS
jgi:DnaJ homolog subfamily C member 7